MTPARAVERLRVEAAQRLLSDTRLPVKRVAARCGFGSEETLRRSFVRLLAATLQVPMTPLSAAAATPPAALAAPPPAPTATPAAVSGLTYPTSQVTVSSAAAGKTVLFPVTINNPYQPHWTVGGIQ